MHCEICEGLIISDNIVLSINWYAKSGYQNKVEMNHMELSWCYLYKCITDYDQM